MSHQVLGLLGLVGVFALLGLGVIVAFALGLFTLDVIFRVEHGYWRREP
jgi:hypothetical protein